MHEPLVGLAALALVLGTLIGQAKLPFAIPGTVAALLLGSVIHYATAPMVGIPLLGGNSLDVGWMPTGWLEVFGFGWWKEMFAAAGYLPIVIPFALATVVGGLDCTESAAQAGDHYSTFQILGVEALATLAAGFCGGVIQTTPYIGHPAYKAMGGKAAYTLATAVTVGLLGIVGGFEYFYMFVPKAAVFPILIFVGLEISSQSFVATPKKHYPALVFACVPALAFLAFFFVDQLIGGIGIQLSGASLRSDVDLALQSLKAVATEGSAQSAYQVVERSLTLRPDLKESLMTVLMLKNGFVLTSLIWASMLAMAIDHRMIPASLFSFIAAVCTLFGFIHCPQMDNSLFLPLSLGQWSQPFVVGAEVQFRVWVWALGYLLVSSIFLGWHYYLQAVKIEPSPDALA